MIVVLAAGSTPNFTFNPLEAGETMTAFIAQAASGDQPTGSIGYESCLPSPRCCSSSR